MKTVLYFAALLVSGPVFAQATQPGVYFVKEKFLEERLAPQANASITNKIYLQQKVDVFEIKNGFARVSKYYDGEVEGKQGQVARWVLTAGLSSTRPALPAQPKFRDDDRIQKGAIPAVGEGGLNKKDVEILHAAANKYLKSGKCSKVVMADKSVNKPNTFYLNCGGPNLFFTPSEL